MKRALYRNYLKNWEFEAKPRLPKTNRFGISSILFVFLAGCGSVQNLNDHMQCSNEMIQANTATVHHSSEVIQSNTQAVILSTKTLEESKEVIAGNTAFLQKVVYLFDQHPYFFPIAFILVLICLLFPSLFLYLAYRALFRRIDPFIEKLKQ